MQSAEFVKLVHRLRSQPTECEWLEFKSNLSDPEQIGQYISALSNSAALHCEPRAYLAWGIEDGTHDVIGTQFDLITAKKGNQSLQIWLNSMLNHDPGWDYRSGDVDGKRVAVLVIPAAIHYPVEFSRVAYIRIGSHKKKLTDHPVQAKQLYRTLDETPFELRSASSDLTALQVLDMLDYGAYFRLQNKSAPDGIEQILWNLSTDKVITKQETERYDITNMGALLFAKRLADFDRLVRKAPRLVKYQGNNKVFAEGEFESEAGYACGFEPLMKQMETFAPRNEVIGDALRTNISMYPPTAMREIVANALIHQDFSISGTGPMIEMYVNRVVVTNPGTPLVDPARFVDAPPVSRNEKLARMMRRCGLCEERGSGWDRIAFEIELAQLPAPLIRVPETQTEVTVYAHRALKEMDRDDRIRATYLHACLRYVSGERLTNTTVRERFGLGSKSAATATGYIREAIDAELILPYDTTAGRKNMQYIPFWAR
jgi:predicted HTH transcriptional regulator